MLYVPKERKDISGKERNIWKGKKHLERKENEHLYNSKLIRMRRVLDNINEVLRKKRKERVH